MESWLALGLDPGTTVISAQAPPPAQIVRLARRVLGILKQMTGKNRGENCFFLSVAAQNYTEFTHCFIP